MRSNVLLTGSIVPPDNMPGVTIREPGERRQQYCDAVNFYARVSDPAKCRLIFAENTGADISDLQIIARRHGHDLMAVSIPSENINPTTGKGPAELALVHAALTRLLAAESEFNRDPVVKITGRLIVKNHHTIQNRLLATIDQMMRRGDHRIISGYMHRTLTYVDTRYLWADLATMSRLFSPINSSVNEDIGQNLEQSTCARVLAAIADGAAWVPVPCVPNVVGRSGSTGRKYGDFHDRLRAVSTTLNRRLALPGSGL